MFWDLVLCLWFVVWVWGWVSWFGGFWVGGFGFICFGFGVLMHLWVGGFGFWVL